MALYFFDIFDGEMRLDREGSVCSSPEAVCQEAMHALPAFAKDRVPADGDKQEYTVLVRDENNVTVYTATLTLPEMWLS